jgi:glycosyltransferase involved in cell wall biosynthesis
LALVKGLDLLIESFARATEQMPEARLVLVGAADPPEFEGRVRGWLDKNGIADRTILTGKLTGNDKLYALAAADIFVLCSQRENFGFSMLDAMASRLPVVVSDTLYLSGKVSGFGAGLVVPRQVESFASAILDLLRNPERRRQMGECGWKLVNTYSWQRTGQSIEETIQAILNRSSLPAELTLGRDGG